MNEKKSILLKICYFRAQLDNKKNLDKDLIEILKSFIRIYLVKVEK